MNSGKLLSPGKKLLGAVMLALLVSGTCANAATLLRGATVHDGNGDTLTDASMRIEGDRIACIGSRVQCPALPGDEIVDVADRFTTPGLVDDIGTLETGKIADLVILEQDPAASARAFCSITHVMRAGVLNNVSEFAGQR